MNTLLSLFLAIFIGVAVASPATQTDQLYAEPSVLVSVELDTPIDEIRYGDQLVLRCVVDGIDEPYHIQWQYSEDKEGWFDIPCTDDVYKFVLDEQNAGLYYRVEIIQY